MVNLAARQASGCTIIEMTISASLIASRKKGLATMASNQRCFAGSTIMIAVLCAVPGLAQPNPARIQPVRNQPVETLTVNPGFRDWSPAAVAGTTILAGNQTGRGGLFAVDMPSRQGEVGVSSYV
jgi:hypothetical protein